MRQRQGVARVCVNARFGSVPARGARAQRPGTPPGRKARGRGAAPDHDHGQAEASGKRGRGPRTRAAATEASGRRRRRSNARGTRDGDEHDEARPRPGAGDEAHEANGPSDESGSRTDAAADPEHTRRRAAGANKGIKPRRTAHGDTATGAPRSGDPARDERAKANGQATRASKANNSSHSTPPTKGNGGRADRHAPTAPAAGDCGKHGEGAQDARRAPERRPPGAARSKRRRQCSLARRLGAKRARAVSPNRPREGCAPELRPCGLGGEPVYNVKACGGAWSFPGRGTCALTHAFANALDHSSCRCEGVRPSPSPTSTLSEPRRSRGDGGALRWPQAHPRPQGRGEGPEPGQRAFARGREPRGEGEAGARAHGEGVGAIGAKPRPSPGPSQGRGLREMGAKPATTEGRAPRI